MKIGIIGPNKIFNCDESDRKLLLNEVAKIIAISENEIILTPDKDSLLEYFGIKYLELGGKNISLIIPTSETDYESYLNTSLGRVIDCGDWDRQADEYNRQCDMFICVGYAWGGMKEIACAQYFNTKDVYIINEFISNKLPEELNFLIKYINIKDLTDLLNVKN